MAGGGNSLVVWQPFERTRGLRGVSREHAFAAFDQVEQQLQCSRAGESAPGVGFDG
jgi:hypothetical protein